MHKQEIQVLNHLGRVSTEAIDQVELLDAPAGSTTVTLNCDEFTSRCPITKMPDFGRLVITYTPRAHLVETKSLKLFLLRYRDEGMFNEVIVADIADKLFEQVKPHYLRVVGLFKHRGGISVDVQATRGAEFYGVIEDETLSSE